MLAVTATVDTRDQLFGYFVNKVFAGRNQIVIASHYYDSEKHIEFEGLEEALLNGHRAGEVRTYARKHEFDTSPWSGAQGARVELLPARDHLLLVLGRPGCGGTDPTEG